MAEVLCVYRQVKILKESAAQSKTEPSDAVAIVVSYDEKPGIQASATTAPDLPPEPGVHATFGRDHEYKRHGTVSLLAGIDLLTGKVHALVKDRHRSREFIEFLELLDKAYPTHTAIKLILDNHSAHISKETKAWLAEQPAGRFEFTNIATGTAMNCAPLARASTRRVRRSLGLASGLSIGCLTPLLPLHVVSGSSAQSDSRSNSDAPRIVVKGEERDGHLALVVH